MSGFSFLAFGEFAQEENLHFCNIHVCAPCAEAWTTETVFRRAHREGLVRDISAGNTIYEFNVEAGEGGSEGRCVAEIGALRQADHENLLETQRAVANVGE
jgi:hypothetical protein